MSSIQKFFPRGEFTPVGCDDALDGAVMALKVLATGRSTGLTKAECETLYKQIWQITNCALTQKEDQESLVTVKESVAEISRNLTEGAPVVESRLIVYSDALKRQVEKMFGIEWAKLKAKGKKREVVRYRTIIINATLRSGVGSLVQLGLLLCRDHASIFHGKNVLHDQFMSFDEEYRRDFETLCNWWNAIKVNRPY